MSADGEVGLPKGAFLNGVRTFLAIALCALLCGICAWLFLAGLEKVTSLRLEDARWFWCAPLVGLITGWVFSRLEPLAGHGSVLLVALARQPRGAAILERVPRALAPLIVIFTWLSHLAGLSVGREGTAIQLGGAMAAYSGKLLGVSGPASARLILMSGVAGGFGAVFHVPWAAAVFALEVSHARFTSGERRAREQKRGSWLDAGPAVRAFAVCLATAFAADAVATALGARHMSFPRFRAEVFVSLNGVLALLAGSVAFGLIAWTFLFLLHEFKKKWAAIVPKDPFRPAIGGLIFAPMALAPEPVLRYAGLGGQEIQKALASAPPAWDWLGKLVFTIFALGTGFKGGEVTPLFFIGASSGAALAQVFGLEPASLGSLGLVAVFGAAADLPVTCALMAAELFGPQALPAALAVCFLANRVCRHTRLYDSKPEI